jgi:activator of HSP90 ATPase
MKMREPEKTLEPSKGPTRRQIFAGAAMAAGGLAAGRVHAWAGVDDGVSHSAAAIHQEAVFAASRKRVYDALTDAKQFQKVMLLGAAAQSAMAFTDKPAEISREMGGTFSIFGGYILGRQIELVADERVVQAWRTREWDPGTYSIAKFELVEQGTGTKVIFDHQGFPADRAEHLAAGWKSNYWEPLAKFLGEAK